MSNILKTQYRSINQLLLRCYHAHSYCHYLCTMSTIFYGNVSYQLFYVNNLINIEKGYSEVALRKEGRPRRFLQ